jgi:hypothetical protein
MLVWKISLPSPAAVHPHRICFPDRERRSATASSDVCGLPALMRRPVGAASVTPAGGLENSWRTSGSVLHLFCFTKAPNDSVPYDLPSPAAHLRPPAGGRKLQGYRARRRAAVGGAAGQAGCARSGSWDVDPAQERRVRPGIAKGSQKVRPFAPNPLKSLKTTMGKPCYKLALRHRWCLIRLASAPRLFGRRGAFRWTAGAIAEAPASRAPRREGARANETQLGSCDDAKPDRNRLKSLGAAAKLALSGGYGTERAGPARPPTPARRHNVEREARPRPSQNRNAHQKHRTSASA